MIIRRIVQGDTLDSLSREYGISAEMIAAQNGLTVSSPLAVGQELTVSIPETVYTVESGDTLYSIARSFNTSVKELMRNNPVLEGNPLVYAGQQLVISYEGDKGREIIVNGYAYTFIDETVLRKALPFLTYLTVFTYGFNDTGDLIIPNDTKIVDIARSYGTESLLLVSTLGEDGMFNNNLSLALFENEVLQDILIENLINEALARGYRGIEVDFEYVGREGRDGYVSFLSRLSNELDKQGLLLFVALAPKTYSEQPGQLYEGHDYRRIGEVADYVILMTYEWGYQYGEPGAVAPIKNVEQVVKYAVEEIPPEKILLGIPNYGYDWTLPYTAGTAAQGISNVGAVELAVNNGAAITFVDELKTPNFEYTDDEGKLHTVWFESAESIEAKLELVSRYNLAGVSIWNIMKYFPQLYTLINGKFTIQNS